MELIEALRSRRSALRLTSPAPSDDEVLALVTDAATGPDHGSLRPWRLVLVRGAARQALGAAFAAELPQDRAAERARTEAKPLRAPLLISIVLTPRENPKVPHWEQLAATAVLVHNLQLLLHARGWGAMWRTGPPSRSTHVLNLLRLDPGELLLGWLYVGTADAAKPPPPRPKFDPGNRLFTLRPHGEVVPMYSAAKSGSRS